MDGYSETFNAGDAANPLCWLHGQWVPSLYGLPPPVATALNPVQSLRTSCLDSVMHALEMSGLTHGSAHLGGLPVAMSTATAAGVGSRFHVLRLVSDGAGRCEPRSRVIGGGYQTTVYVNWVELTVSDIDRLCRLWVVVGLLKLSNVYIDGLEVQISQAAVQSLHTPPH